MVGGDRKFAKRPCRGIDPGLTTWRIEVFPTQGGAKTLSMQQFNRFEPVTPSLGLLYVSVCNYIHTKLELSAEESDPYHSIILSAYQVLNFDAHLTRPEPFLYRDGLHHLQRDR